jgi:hypothetical protein
VEGLHVVGGVTIISKDKYQIAINYMLSCNSVCTLYCLVKCV